MIKEIKTWISNSIIWVWHHSQNIVGWLGFLLACIAIYFQTIDKVHNLNIVISSYEPRDNWVVFGVLYSNPGDHTETIVGGSATMVWSEESGSGWGSFLEDCFEPVIIKAKETVHRYYTVRFPLYEDKNLRGAKSEHKLYMSFRVLMPNGAVGTERIRLGEIEHRTSDGKIEKISIDKNILPVTFNSHISTGLGTIYLPLTYVSPDIPTCSNKLKPRPYSEPANRRQPTTKHGAADI